MLHILEGWRGSVDHDLIQVLCILEGWRGSVDHDLIQVLYILEGWRGSVDRCYVLCWRGKNRQVPNPQFVVILEFIKNGLCVGET